MCAAASDKCDFSYGFHNAAKIINDGMFIERAEAGAIEFTVKPSKEGEKKRCVSQRSLQNKVL